MHKGESTGGREPLVPDAVDIQVAIELAQEGLTEEQIAKALGVAYSTFREIKDRDKNFSAAIKKGRVAEYIEANRQIKAEGIPPALYIYWSKTKWKHFYPQEDKTPQIVQQLEGIKFINDTKALDAKTKE